MRTQRTIALQPGSLVRVKRPFFLTRKRQFADGSGFAETAVAVRVLSRGFRDYKRMRQSTFYGNRIVLSEVQFCHVD